MTWRRDEWRDVAVIITRIASPADTHLEQLEHLESIMLTSSQVHLEHDALPCGHTAPIINTRFGLRLSELRVILCEGGPTARRIRTRPPASRGWDSHV